MKNILLKLNYLFIVVEDEDRNKEEVIFTPGSEPFVLGMFCFGVIVTLLWVSTSLILYKYYSWCYPDPVLYSLFIWGLITVILCLLLIVYSILTIGFKENLIMLFLGMSVSGIFYLSFSLIFIIPGYQRLFFIPICQ